MELITIVIEGSDRQALIYKPKGTKHPVIFAYHGHGGTAQGFSNKQFEQYWPKAIVVYPQGLKTPSSGDAKAEKTGWQHKVGEEDLLTGVIDKDLKFFDAMMTTLVNEYDADANMVFVHGWSNGGEFIYDCLWSARATKITAICAASAILNTTDKKIPLPVMHLAGKADPVVSFLAQFKAFQTALVLNECTFVGAQWYVSQTDPRLSALLYVSQIQDRCVFLQYPDGHNYDNLSYSDEIIPLIPKFFKNAYWHLTH